jgi:hypothetical protein
MGKYFMVWYDNWEAKIREVLKPGKYYRKYNLCVSWN